MVIHNHAYPGSSDPFLDRLIGIRARSSMIRQVPVSYAGTERERAAIPHRRWSVRLSLRERIEVRARATRDHPKVVAQFELYHFPENLDILQLVMNAVSSVA